MTAPAELNDDVAEIIGVVLGTEKVELDKPRRAEALAAMNALGYSTDYMAEQLGVARRTVASMASALNVKLTPERQFVDVRAVEWVLTGTPMTLRGNDLNAALRRLAERGAPIGEIARLTRASRTVIRARAAKLGLDLIEDPEDDCWWHRYYDIVRDAGKDKTDG